MFTVILIVHLNYSSGGSVSSVIAGDPARTHGTRATCDAVWSPRRGGATSVSCHAAVEELYGLVHSEHKLHIVHTSHTILFIVHSVCYVAYALFLTQCCRCIHGRDLRMLVGHNKSNK